MARKTNLTPQKQDVPEKPPLLPPDRPLLDLPDEAIKTLIRTARKHGYIRGGEPTKMRTRPKPQTA